MDNYMREDHGNVHHHSRANVFDSVHWPAIGGSFLDTPFMLKKLNPVSNFTSGNDRFTRQLLLDLAARRTTSIDMVHELLRSHLGATDYLIWDHHDD